jgi:hypothetical protein
MKVYKRDIALPDGNVLELEHNDHFLDQVREKMELEPHQEVDADAIKGFIYGALGYALKKHDEGHWVSSQEKLDKGF